jgi:hypothetical protein
MNRFWIALATSVVACLALTTAVPAVAAEPQVAHMVYFKLKDNSDASKAQLVAACNKYLSRHEGTVYYSAGVMAQDMNRDVNDRDFDVALNLVFRDKAALDKYATHPRHTEFIEKCKDSWEKVRVFDSYISAAE